MAAKKKTEKSEWNRRLVESAQRAKEAMARRRKPTEREKDEREMYLERRAAESRNRYEHPEEYYSAEDYSIPFDRRPQDDERRAAEDEHAYADYRFRGRGYEPPPEAEYDMGDDWADATVPEKFKMLHSQAEDEMSHDTPEQAQGQAEEEYRERMRRKAGY